MQILWQSQPVLKAKGTHTSKPATITALDDGCNQNRNKISPVLKNFRFVNLMLKQGATYTIYILDFCYFDSHYPF